MVPAYTRSCKMVREGKAVPDKWIVASSDDEAYLKPFFYEDSIREIEANSLVHRR